MVTRPRLEEAESLLRQAVEWAQRSLGAPHAGTVMALGNLEALLWDKAAAAAAGLASGMPSMCRLPPLHGKPLTGAQWATVARGYRKALQILRRQAENEVRHMTAVTPHHAHSPLFVRTVK